MHFTSLLTIMLDAVFVRRCVFCAARVDRVESAICDPCYYDLPWRQNFCEPLPTEFDCVVVPLQYAFPIDAAIKAFKFKRKLFYAPAFVQVLIEATAALDTDVDAVLSVPLHWRRKALRGFNQVDELVRPIASAVGAPVVACVRRQNATAYQSGLSAIERRKNLRAAFRLCGPTQFHHVLLVDDVITTGATLSAMARLLRKAGVQKVSVLAIARASYS